MPRRALLERRPWLLVSLGAAIAYYGLKDADFPGTYLLAIEAVSLLLLSGYAILRHHDADSRMLAGALACAGLGVVGVELYPYAGALVLIIANALLTALFVRHTRPLPAAAQKAAAVALLLLVPLISWRLPLDRDAATLTGIYGLSLGGMAGSAWLSAFPRYRTGIGALLCVVAGMLGIAGAGVLADSDLPSWFSWPAFYIGHFLMAVGTVQTLRAGFLR
jgi:hypothetical protein